MEQCPENLEYLEDNAMSNFDHEIDRGVEKQLRKGGCCAAYTAWNFWGLVWHDGLFKCQIMRYHSHIATLEAETLEEIMETASEEWGRD